MSIQESEHHSTSPFVPSFDIVPNVAGIKHQVELHTSLTMLNHVSRIFNSAALQCTLRSTDHIPEKRIHNIILKTPLKRGF